MSNNSNLNINQYKFFSIKVDFLFFIKLFAIFSMISMYFTLIVPIDGEEGTYTISAMEMYLNGHYFDSTIYGNFYGRPPLLSWLIIGICKIIGFSHVLIASRFVNATMVILTGLVLFYLINVISKSKPFAWITLACFYSEIVLMRLGWLAYSDCTLMFFTFLAIALLWLGVEKQKNRYFIIASLSLLCAFLTKAITPYYYYAAFGLVLLIRHENRMFLIRPVSFLVHILALILPFIFIYFANPDYLFRMLSDAFGSGGGELLSSLDKVPHYLYQALIFQPIQLITTTAPFSLIAIYAIIFKKELKSYQYIELAKIGFLTFFIAFIPFWFSWNHWPEGRYYLPVIPALSIWFAYFIYNASDKLKKITLCLLAITLVIKLLLGSFGFYAFYKNFRPDYPLIAKDIIHIVKDAPLTVSRGGTAEGLGIASSLDEQLMPYKTVTDYTKKMPRGISYFVYPSGNRNLPIKLEKNQHLVKAYLHKYSPRSIFLIEQINSSSIHH